MKQTQSNPNGWKYWHRIVKNDLQHNDIIKRPSNRFDSFKRKFTPWKKDGKKNFNCSTRRKTNEVL